MTTEVLIARLRDTTALSDPLLTHEAADALEALGREVAELKQKMFDESEAMVSIVQVKYPQALAERDQARAELAAIRATDKDAGALVEAKPEFTLAQTLEDVKHYLCEAEQFAAMSPRGKENIGIAISLLNAIPFTTKDGLHIVSGKTADELWAETGRLRAELADLKRAAAPADKDAGLVADGWKLERIDADQIRIAWDGAGLVVDKNGSGVSAVAGVALYALADAVLAASPKIGGV